MEKTKVGWRPTHGGSRKGAGRPTADGAKNTKQVLVMLTPEHVEKAKAKGDGNMSLGIRRALDSE